MTNDALKAAGARIVFWPEAAMTFFLGDEPTYQRAIGRVLAPYGAELVAGGPRRIGSEDEATFLNSTFVVQPSGHIAGYYDKEQLLPFAEYFPLHTRDLMRRDPGEVREFAPGSPTPPLPTAAGPAGVIVCNEAMFPEPAARRIADGAEFLVNPSNDSWPDDLEFSLQVFDIVRLRAIEQRRTLVRTSTSGPSAIVDPVGRVRAWAAPESREWISGPIEPSRRRTIYSRLGDAFGAVCLAIGALAVIRAGVTRPRAAPLPGGDGRGPRAAPAPDPG
jgi:apolipoprotein N-acyltransferase